MEKRPLFQNISPAGQLFALIVLTFVSFFLVVIVGLLVAVPVTGITLQAMLNGIAATTPESINFLKYFQIISQIGFFILPVFLFSYLIHGNISTYLLMKRNPGMVILLVVAALFILIGPFTNWLVALNEKMHLPSFLENMERWMKEAETNADELTKAFMATRTWGGFGVNLLMIAILPALGEELFFRGAILRIFFDWSNIRWLAVVTSALLFSAMHMQFYGFVPRFMLGLVLGYSYVWSGSLWVPIAGHFVNNALAVVAAFLYQRGVITTNLDELGSTGGYLEILISAVVSAALIIFLFQQSKRKTIPEAPENSPQD